MKIKILLYSFLIAISIQPFAGRAQAVNTQDSLALVDLYNSTNGAGWINHTNWLTAAPLGSWFGVTVENGRVINLNLQNNKLSGIVPSSLGNLSQINFLILSFNQLSGNIPPSLANLPTGFILDFRYNQLKGAISPAFTNLPNSTAFQIDHNKFTFDGMEAMVANLATHHYGLSCNPQGDIPLHQNGNVLSVSAGGTLSNNTYQWYNDDILVATKTGDSTFTISIPGNYSVSVSNAVVTTNPIIHGAAFELTLYSTSIINQQDSLALVDIYNNTNGSGWINSTNWMSSALVSSWYGVTVRKGRVTRLELPANNLNGTIPNSLVAFSNLETVSLQGNQLNGSMPALMGNLSNLTVVDFSNNQLSGDIPSSLTNLSNLKTLNLNNNQLTGAIPPAFGSLNNLHDVNISNNQLSGTIPGSIGTLNQISTFRFSNNQLTGTIPASVTSLLNLFTLDLSNNQLSGNIPDFISNPKLTELKLGNNQLSGNIPDSLFTNPRLFRLYLNSNQLTGKIPDSLGAHGALIDVDIHDNQLSGGIPLLLATIGSVGQVQIQLNRFTFDGMEQLQSNPTFPTVYSPQATIPLHRNGNLLSVSAGGTLANDTFRLFKDGIVVKGQIGDSTFVINGAGKYYVTVTNTVATKLTLISTIDTIPGLALTPGNTTAMYNIAGVDSINILDLPYHNLMLTVVPGAGVNALNGNVDFKVTIDPSVQVFNNQPYVQRHFDIVPASNPTTATATVKLYFTQTDFDNFNAAPAHGLDLPSGPADAAGIANLRVYQYHGFSTTSLPGSYSGNAIEINPDDANIIWNDDAQYWVVSFDVNGFSGFFVSSLNNALLPIKLLSFTGQVKGSIALLQWVTEKEINTSYFEVQRGTDGRSFNTVTKVNASGNSSNNIRYNYSDPLGSAPVNYYRLKMFDKDGRYTYSSIIKLSTDAAADFKIYPNPVKDFVIIELPVTTRDTKIKLLDMNGRVVQMTSVPKAASQIKLNVRALPAGSYKIVFDDGVRLNVRTLLIE